MRSWWSSRTSTPTPFGALLLHPAVMAWIVMRLGAIGFAAVVVRGLVSTVRRPGR